MCLTDGQTHVQTHTNKLFVDKTWLPGGSNNAVSLRILSYVVGTREAGRSKENTDKTRSDSRPSTASGQSSEKCEERMPQKQLADNKERVRNKVSSIWNWYTVFVFIIRTKTPNGWSILFCAARLTDQIDYTGCIIYYWYHKGVGKPSFNSPHTGIIRNMYIREPLLAKYLSSKELYTFQFLLESF